MAAAVLVLAYLMGSFPTARLVAGRTGHDPDREGSGNPGASNVYRVAGRRAGVAVFAGDMAKGAAAAAIGLAVDGRPLGVAAGMAAVIGHTLPPWGRRGGKGVATAAGLTLVLYPLVGAVAVTLWLAIARLLGKASVASLVAVVLVPAGVLVVRGGGEAAAVAAMALYIIGRHHENIRRLLAGDERTLRG